MHGLNAMEIKASLWVMSNIEILFRLLPEAVFDTLWMTCASSFFALLFGLPLGLLLYTTSSGNFRQNLWIHRPVSVVVDSLRTIPFIILAAGMMPLTRIVVGKAVGNEAMIFVLSVSAIPFYARMAELSFRGVDKNLIEAVRVMGATRFQIIWEVAIPEALSSLIIGFTVTVISIVAASAMAGFIGGNGLGRLAISYGYQRYNPVVMISVIFILILLNIAIQWFGDRMAHKIEKIKGSDC
ncbi:MAG: D-methionine transport system permease protein [Candidatus Tokpelaia sp. JSC161]|jgi:D-methionine transport system permease protein|nr:MAG: D-methionine transport system permease protein [Candidatus Tokpelaia sp. JSC161]